MCIEAMNALTQHPPAVRTTCPYCGVGCGVLASPDGLGGATIAGDPAHPANLGKLCSKGTALGETLSLDDRLLHPMIRQPDGALVSVPWSDALDQAATGFSRIVERDGPDAVAFYLSGQLLTEDYYVANKLMKGFVGTANVDTNSRLCMASSVAGHRRAFGADIVPQSYEDLDEADLIVLVGSNAAWCHPVLFHRMLRAREKRGTKIVVIDPRRTASGEDADLFLPVAPGMDTALFSGLLVYLSEQHALDYDYIARHTTGFENALVRAREIAPDIAATAAAAGLDESLVARFFDLFTRSGRVLTCFSQGVNQSAQGTDKVNAIINCHLATGRIGKPGAGPFSLTGQPNAMGGREVGGLANQLAAHMNFSSDEIGRVQRFWNAPRMAEREGLKAVQMFEAIEKGRIKALWVMATNPAVSLPRAGAMREAMQKLELLVVSENVASNDTVHAGAHILLPAAAWGEKDGTVTNSERRVSRQRPFLPLPGEAKPDWWMVCEVAKRMGFGEGFGFRSAADIFREHAALSGFENDGARDFDLGGLADIDDDTFNALDPMLWPVRANGERDKKRFFADGGFFTADRKARLIAVEKPELVDALSDAFPLRLNTGRVRDQWHTMTRTGKSPRLGAHIPEPFAEIHPADADTLGVTEGGFAQITSRHGRCVLRVRISEGQRPGSVFVPIHWTGETGPLGRTGDLVAPRTDPYSGQPEAKATPCAVAPIAFANRGFILARDPVALPDGTWWSRVALDGGFGYLLASDDGADIWRDVVTAQFGNDAAEYADTRTGVYRAAAFDDSRLRACLFLSPADITPSWDALKALLGARKLEDARRRALLSGESLEGVADTGPLLCACFGVGVTAIRDALASGRARSVEEIGKLLRAGTNCGSCVPEMRKLIASNKTASDERIVHEVAAEPV
jgi:assimilatory nitrate reductase catalytic subunit